MRKKKNSESRLLACEKYLLNTEGGIIDPNTAMGEGYGKVFLEIGAGKGGFACAMAERHSDTAYYAMERVTDCVVLCAEKASSGEFGELNNLRFVIDTADNLMHIFSPGSVDAIFLNFSDPWSKKGYAKRRLTHRRYLAMYLILLRDGGVLRFKTDNVGLFDFSLEEFAEFGINVEWMTRDLHNSERAEGNVMTEYEKNFSEKGFTINSAIVRF
jgi:tRNA (guanine-N7-)-methyltransferase